MKIRNWLTEPASGRGVRLADPDQGWTFHSYTELAGKARGISAALQQVGVAEGDVVTLILTVPEQFIVALGGTWLAGATASTVATPGAHRGRGRYLDYLRGVLAVGAPTAVLCDPALLKTVRQILADLGSSAAALDIDPATIDDRHDSVVRAAPDTALVQFTSGSSGPPRGIVISTENLEANLRAIHRWVSFTREDSVASWLPLYHDMGLVGSLLTPATKGSDLWLLQPEQFIRRPLRWLECMGSGRATVTTAPNFGYAYATRRVRPDDLAGMDFSSWRVAILGAERVDPVVVADFTRLVEPHGFRATSLTPAYGLAESTLAVTGAVPGEGTRIIQVRSDAPHAPDGLVTLAATGQLGVDRPTGPGWLTSCGPPVGDAGVAVLDEDGSPLPEGHLGELHVSSSSVAQGYRSAGAPVERAAGTEFTSTGLRTGDAGFVLDGEVFVVGRIGDSMKVRGHRVYAEDLEQNIAKVSGLAPAKCGVALGSLLGVDLVAVFVEQPIKQPSTDISGALRSMTGDAARTAVFRVRSGGIPRTSSGKIQRRTLWHQLLAGEVSGELVHTDWDVEIGVPPWQAPLATAGGGRSEYSRDTVR